jgi:hypothetical protein
MCASTGLDTHVPKLNLVRGFFLGLLKMKHGLEELFALKDDSKSQTWININIVAIQ